MVAEKVSSVLSNQSRVTLLLFLIYSDNVAVRGLKTTLSNLVDGAICSPHHEGTADQTGANDYHCHKRWFRNRADDQYDATQEDQCDAQDEGKTFEEDITKLIHSWQ